MTDIEAPVVSVRDVHVRMGTTQALRGVSFDVLSGEVVAILGPNGSGKSTVIKAIVGLVEAQSGSIELFGTPIRRFSQRSRIGYVPQRTTAASGVPATVQEIVASGRQQGLFGIRRAADKKAVIEAMEAVDVADLRHRSVAQLSGGQQQRVLIARALARQPELLILDEPLAGVDIEQQDSLATTLQHLRGQGRTIVIVLHELGPIAPLITHVVGLRGGLVQYNGAPADAPVEHHVPHGGHDHVHPHDEDDQPYQRPALLINDPMSPTPDGEPLHQAQPTARKQQANR